MLQNGGGGSDRSWDGNLWVHPLPPEGPVTFVVSWLEQGVAETGVELDGAAIREAARRAVILWPDDPEFEPHGAMRSQRVTAGMSDGCGSPVGTGRGGRRRNPERVAGVPVGT